MTRTQPSTIKIKFTGDDETVMGPVKHAMLDAIATHGWTAAAARQLAKSDRWACSLVDAINR